MLSVEKEMEAVTQGIKTSPPQCTRLTTDLPALPPREFLLPPFLVPHLTQEFIVNDSHKIPTVVCQSLDDHAQIN